MVDPATFRGVMAQWPSGVTVVTTLTEDGTWHGMTASSFSSVSLDPPLVSICLTKTLYSHDLIAASGVFGINVLAKDQIDVGRRFAGMDPEVADRFAGESWSVAETGVPLLDSSLGWFDCRVVHAYPGGDHTIFVGEVVAGHAARRSAPLLFHSRGWGQFADVLPDVATLSDTAVVADLAARGRGDDVERVASVLTGAGVRVRIADLTVAGAEMGPTSLPLDAVSVVAHDAGQARSLLEQGVGTIEFHLDPADNVELDHLLIMLTEVEGLAARSAVHLQDPFAPERLEEVLHAVQQLNALAVGEIGLLDTDGRATPLRIRAVLQEAVALARPVPLRVALHDRDRLGLVKAIIALKSGVRHLDSTLGGRGGAVATEHLIRLLEEVDVATPVDTAALVALATELAPQPTVAPVVPGARQTSGASS